MRHVFQMCSHSTGLKHGPSLKPHLRVCATPQLQLHEPTLSAPAACLSLHRSAVCLRRAPMCCLQAAVLCGSTAVWQHHCAAIAELRVWPAQCSVAAQQPHSRRASRSAVCTHVSVRMNKRARAHAHTHTRSCMSCMAMRTRMDVPCVSTLGQQRRLLQVRNEPAGSERRWRASKC